MQISSAGARKARESTIGRARRQHYLMGGKSQCEEEHNFGAISEMLQMKAPCRGAPCCGCVARGCSTTGVRPSDAGERTDTTISARPEASSVMVIGSGTTVVPQAGLRPRGRSMRRSATMSLVEQPPDPTEHGC